MIVLNQNEMLQVFGGDSKELEKARRKQRRKARREARRRKRQCPAYY